MSQFRLNKQKKCLRLIDIHFLPCGQDDYKNPKIACLEFRHPVYKQPNNISSLSTIQFEYG